MTNQPCLYSFLLLKLLECMEQLVYRLPFLDSASAKQTDNQLLIRSIRFMQVELPLGTFVSHHSRLNKQ